MRKTWAVIKREFRSFTGSKAYVLGTLFGPAALILLLALPGLLEKAGGAGEARELEVEVARPGGPGVEELRRRVAAGELDGYLILPDDPSEPVVYEGRAGNVPSMARLRVSTVQAVQRARLLAAGIDPEDVDRATAPVRFETRIIGPPEGIAGGAAGADEPPEQLINLVLFLNTMIYIVILLYGISVLRSIQEEKERRVVEILLSSLRPGQLMTGKVLGIGAAGLLQVAIWVGFAVVLLTSGDEILTLVGISSPEIPHVPGALAVVILAFFAGGYFLYAALYATLGGMATTWQDAQNLQFPAMFLLMAAFFVTFAAIENPGSDLAEVASLVPFTSPFVVPARTALGAVGWVDLALPFAILVLGCAALLWAGGRIFRFSILSTGVRPTPRRVWRWLRAG